MTISPVGAVGRSKAKLTKRYHAELLCSRWNVADLYRRFKAAADRGKDYGLASGFYFNEFEMRRRWHHEQCTSEHVNRDNLSRVAVCYLRWLTYSTYKFLAGYGEKPLWSFLWLCTFVVIFAVLNLFAGIQVPSMGTINYDLRLSLPDFGCLFHHFCYAILITLQRFIPVSYVSSQIPLLRPADSGILDIGLTLLNTVMLVTMIVFTGIGLKRHFRRF
ncbi:MAG: hypothetical protein KKG33_00125 [candidate division Zixibacteria bacterium]|nr:hypothetical protein [candidate division Zixibacteria bacterium]